MIEEKFIRKGYFTKELPPPFYTEKMADNLNDIKKQWQAIFSQETTKLSGESKSDFKQRKCDFVNRYSSSKSWKFNISKGILARRPIEIPNPKHFIKVVELISEKWSDFQAVFTNSSFSSSYPIEETDQNKRAVKTLSKNVSDLRDRILDASVNKLIQVKLDISKFYPTIYTHIIPWCWIGKEESKKYFKMSKVDFEAEISANNPSAIGYDYSNKLDNAIRACQDKQSIGLPIGPDTSHILSELVACKIDEEFSNTYSNVNATGCRYYDDYYVFVNTNDEADIVIKGLQKILNKYQLELNDRKIEIDQYPIPFENEWVTDLNRFEFKSTNLSNSIKHYFSLIWGIGQENKSRTDWVFKYSLKLFEFGTVLIPKKSWRLFENLLLKTTLMQPAILDITTRIFITYSEHIDSVSKTKMKDLIEAVITNHSQVNHNFEVSWSLWLAKTFEIQIEESIANKVIETKDSSAILILLCLDKEHKLVSGNPDYSTITSELTDNVLFSEYWILAYEAVRKNWLTPSNSSLIADNKFFSILNDLDVEFFDCSRQLKVYKNIESIEQNINVSEATQNIETKEKSDKEKMEWYNSEETISISGIM